MINHSEQNQRNPYNHRNLRSAFTLVEIMVSLAIIAIITMASFAAFDQARQNSRDTKRLADIHVLQTALADYYRDEGSYPASIVPGAPLVGPTSNKTYLTSIPLSPAPRNDNGCPDQDYVYHPLSNNSDYAIDFCLAKKSGVLPSGILTAGPESITACANAIWTPDTAGVCGSILQRSNCSNTRLATGDITCSAPLSCGGGGIANQCGCTAESDAHFCTRLGKACGSVSDTDTCGQAKTVTNCGDCPSNQACGGSGTPNQCGCSSETDTAFCARLGATCGSLTNTDNCGQTRTVADCGSCTNPQTCGGSGTANQCGCAAETDIQFCARLGKACGSVTDTDNCGQARTVADCGSCNTGFTCVASACKFVCGGQLTDVRDAQAYPTVQIGTQCWMAKNMNIGTMVLGANDQTNNSIIEKYCYADNSANCTTDGGLYQWGEMVQYINPAPATANVQGICPSGWHVSTDADQSVLEQYLTDGTNTCDANRLNTWGCANAGTKLKSGGSSGFNGIIAGYRDYGSKSFSFRGTYAYFWTSLENTASSAYGRYLLSVLPGVMRSYYEKGDGFSVRCLQD